MTAEATQLGRPTEDLETIAARLDETMASIAALEPSARQAVNAALTSLDSLHARALTTIVRALKEDARGKELLFELVDEPVVRMVLSMHEIIRPDPTTLALRTLDQVRPQLQGHGGDVVLDRIEGTTAYVRLQGACNGCSMASVTMRQSVEQALLHGVPGLIAVEVVPNDPAPTVIPLSSIGLRPATDTTELRASGWIESLTSHAVGELTATTVRPESGPEIEVILLARRGTITAYRNACAHQGNPLDGAIIDDTEGTLTCPWHGLCFDIASGECTSLPGAQLEQFPVQVVDDVVWIRPEGL